MKTRDFSSKTDKFAQSKLEKLHEEAEIALTEKRNEIQDLNDKIDFAEQQFTQLKADLKVKMFQMQELEANAEEEDQNEEEDMTEFIKLKQSHEEKMQKLITDHEDEIKTLQNEFTRKLKAAEEWNKQHAETLRMNKQTKIDELKDEINAIKERQNMAIYTQTKKRNKMLEESKIANAENAQKIQVLENQISEVQAMSREELRDIRAKIEECLATVELRQKEHENELKRYEKEIEDRNETYKLHISALKDQLNNEQERLNQEINAVDNKISAMEKILAQLENHHQKQVEATTQGIEKMKLTISNLKTRGDQTIETIRTTTAQTTTSTREMKQLQEEIKLLDKEIIEIQNENADLKAELAHIQQSNQRKNAK